ncbi:hypothetical protein GLOIN_2v1881885 [Rhizophagus irregularis DAOM 181602=DAOM 197198]|uniref:Uncharacterized protein n=1 Tax=Rhizophagus irregularis (strain DAOM 181602 / DAOM 197198 / MUCL 43194) TaxID=747089 RepID=A0A2P4PEH5_RHIID|nr:hypothetical protein GLOIN_2v1881885 [Rhizophagus irregularis DAOM 181602=DAOM 197198]POG63771.1 hypothetical protein GLOIN_2v1881885 [Rhizophagus irregularis DAOM 181602=DAOM 197198]GET55252.1 hypothetical protein GLOIN_2v1881885 [Rhizophagus irregularis DAOM 181602=DAOM 197198]|eukprot:XP_025170637.1 hypothetical protein GLOIN_2v1881885 [Rhizophagus irregularis DAOM 181602=DAOM 197198]
MENTHFEFNSNNVVGTVTINGTVPLIIIFFNVCVVSRVCAVKITSNSSAILRYKIEKIYLPNYLLIAHEG